jgi:Rieske Fe-S protein
VLQKERLSRRMFLMKIGLLLNGAVALMIAMPIVRYLLGPVAGSDAYRKWIEIGNVDDFRDGETRLVTYINPFTDPWDGETRKIPAYVRRVSANDFTVFAVNCAHLDCPVRWFPESQLFMCPCHGGVYYADGERASGPPERGLFKYDRKIEGGKLFINAGQMPTLSNRAQLIQEISPCSGQNGSITG